MLLYRSLADIACSYEQMLCGCKQSVGETGSVFNIDKEQNGGLFKLCADNFSIIKGAADTISCLQMKLLTKAGDTQDMQCDTHL